MKVLPSPLSAAVLLALASIGCSESIQTAEVEGVLLVHGAPAQKILVQFIPNVDKGTKGPMSTAKTDANGRFTLNLMEGNGASTRPGAVIGWHRIVLSDLQLAESATGAGLPIRLPQEVTLPGSTPLEQEVKTGKQTLELKIP